MTQANVSEIAYVSDKSQVTEEVMSGVITDAEILIAMDELMDYRAEYERLTKEKKKLEGEVARVSGKLSNENFVSKALEKIIGAERKSWRSMRNAEDGDFSSDYRGEKTIGAGSADFF